MKVRDLMKHWETNAGGAIAAREFSVKLPLYDAARILALADMYPAKTVDQLITELLGAALDEIEEAFPYRQGEKVIAEDEYHDPIYEDVGPTPTFVERTKSHERLLAAESKRKRTHD